MFENRHDTEIAGTVEQVWVVLSDLDRYAVWNPTIRRASGDLRVGGAVEFSVGEGASQRAWTVTVSRVEPGREFAWTFHETLPVLFRGEHIFRVDPIDHQHTRYVDRETFAGLYVPLRRRTIATQYRAGMVAMGQALKQRVESLGTDPKVQPVS